MLSNSEPQEIFATMLALLRRGAFWVVSPYAPRVYLSVVFIGGSQLRVIHPRADNGIKMVLTLREVGGTYGGVVFVARHHVARYDLWLFSDTGVLQTPLSRGQSPPATLC